MKFSFEFKFRFQQWHHQSSKTDFFYSSISLSPPTHESVYMGVHIISSTKVAEGKLESRDWFKLNLMNLIFTATTTLNKKRIAKYFQLRWDNFWRICNSGKLPFLWGPWRGTLMEKKQQPWRFFVEASAANFGGKKNIASRFNGDRIFDSNENYRNFEKPSHLLIRLYFDPSAASKACQFWFGHNANN